MTFLRVAVTLLLTAPLAAQNPWGTWGAQAIPSLTQANVVPGGVALAELRVVQPVLMGQAGAFDNHLLGQAVLDGEGWTMPNGELTPGIWGEAFVDRRHPHTYFHELMLSGIDLLGSLDRAANVSISTGKGFAPFGSDDPMVRPVQRFPMNHHYSQILERAVLILGVRAGPVAAEAGLFNGDEPVSPSSWPNMDRFGDSWSGRLRVTPLPALELEGSYAHVRSPENREPIGLDQVKYHASARWDHGPVYGLAEWARTSEGGGVYVFNSILAEGAWHLGRHLPYARYEQTERPEEPRTFDDPYRLQRPVLEDNLLGETRWTIITGGYSFGLLQRAGFVVRPLFEASWIRVQRVDGGLFDPAIWYGREEGYQVSIGLRLGYGMTMPRMGTYGVAPSDAGRTMSGMSRMP